MATAIVPSNHIDAIEQALITGNIGALQQTDRLAYYDKLCKSLGLNPLTQPFEYLTLNGKVRLYAKKDCTDQLRSINGVSVTRLEKERIEDVYAVTAYVQDGKGRVDSAVGAVAVGTLKGEALANALMKAETKAKRRATLSICGLGFLDETEIETIPQHVIQQAPAQLEAHETEAKLDCVDCSKEIDAYAYIDGKGAEKFITLEKVREANKRDFPEVNLCGKCQILRHNLRRKMNSDEPIIEDISTAQARQIAAAQPTQAEIDPAINAAYEADSAVNDETGRAVGTVKKVWPKSGKKPYAISLQIQGDVLHFSTFSETEGKKLQGAEGKHIVLSFVKDGKYRNINEIEKIGDQDFVIEGEPF